MAVMIKCKMCGGDLQLTEGSTIATCEYCGTQQTVPTMDNEKKLVQFERAERLRRNCEFDKAAGVYESIVADFRQEAEAYWGLVLCKYGIEYVDDPASGKKVPTCHRSSFDSIMEDPNFDLTMENADAVSLQVYRKEAKQIEEIRKGIIEVSAKEDPYDIFICYKETDSKGDRTIDSLIAQDIYDALTDKGYRVFFSRITLEDKLGVAYEPYIFAALNSAKVMLAVGTAYEHYNAVWVKNEWSRFLKLMEKDKNKHLIPCFKDIDAYDIPKEFKHLQAQDMGKVGAMQDLVRGIDKLISVKPAATSTVGVQTDDVNRIYVYNSALEDMKSKKVKKAKEAVSKLESLGNWNDAPKQLENARKHLKKRKTARTVRRIITWVIIFGIIGGAFGLVWSQLKQNYDEGMRYMNQGQYSRAINQFASAEFYSANGVSAEEMAAEARRLANLSDEKLRALVNGNGNPIIFYGEAWLAEVLQRNAIHEGEVMLHEGSIYNGYLDCVNVDFLITGEVGSITYLEDADTFLYTSDSGDSQTVRFENGNMVMEDGTVYGGSGAMMKKLGDHVATLAQNADMEQVESVMAIMTELVYSGLITADEGMLSAASNMANNAVGLAVNGRDEGVEMLLMVHKWLYETLQSGAVMDGQAAYNAAESIVNAAEQLINNGYDAGYEIMAMTMEYYPMAEAGVFGFDPEVGPDYAVIEQFKMLYDRCEQIINN